MERGPSSASEWLNGLKFGKKIYFEDVGSGLEGKSGGGSLSSSPAKKGRSGVAHGGQPPRCQVEGCMVDLSDAKAYYSRHKVCGMHSKSSKVIVAGIEQRFCQQCSRFHKLPEFDQGKRSCRRRLACHNERRRKPPQGSILSSHFGALSPTTTTILSPNMFDNHRKAGGFLMDFTTFTTPAQESWQNATTERDQQLPWQPNLQNPLPNLLQSPTTRPTYSSPGVSSADCFGSDSNGALSLLSIQQPWGSRTRPTSLNGFLGTDTNANGTTALFHPSIGQFSCPPDLGLGQINGQYNNNGELGLAQPSDGRYHDLDHSRGYDSLV